jgi:hypothetical protein
VARGGFFRRAISAVREFFTGEGEAPPRAAPRSDRDRQRARERDPYLAAWDSQARGRTGYLNHREIIDDLASTYDLDEEEKQELWDDYLEYIVGERGERMRYRRNDIHNPFWQKWGIDPEEQFDWHAWREAMGYPHGDRK